MTTPNATTNGFITSFSWKSFPVEEEKFFICLVQSGEKMTREFENLYEYIKIVFPEKIVYSDSPDWHNISGTLLKKTSVICECKKEKNWIESHNLTTDYLRNSHVIVSGEFDNIPSTVFTNSRIIIFESDDDSNRYIQKTHCVSLNNFNTRSNFIVIDKSIMGHFNIYGLLKTDLIRYSKENRLSH